jgi:NAD+ synthase (glutamine-hydrolysing)
VALGLSGGLDSTLALLVCVRAFELLGLDRKGIYCVTMPGFGTTGRTLANAESLSARLGTSLETIDIRDACAAQFKDLGLSENSREVAYENVQARYRTSLLMNKSNMLGALVIGTGDLSELALGWCTYNGDHMSMYAVNTGVPKTLVKYLIKYVADTSADGKTAGVLADIIATPISPELLPPDAEGKIAQKTEEVIGPYELHDFFLFNAIRCGFPPRKVYYLACRAFNPENPAPAEDKETSSYSEDKILKWLKVFYRRFFSQQFKRSCLPDGPKVGTLALSPRGDWRMPSDASAALWLEELETI